MTGVPSQLDVQELLTAQDFVRRLARSLVFDQQKVDDVVQEAWLAAVQRPPQRAAMASWFRSTLQHLARRRARDDVRRRTRELAVARPEALPSAAEVLAREEQRREVVDAVMALPEPYRGIVLARFFDELEPGEIARRRGMPAATVRSQLHRALEMLRQQLDERHGSRQAWGLWLVPLAKPAHTTGMGLVTAAGALLMAKILIGAGLMTLLVFGFLSFGTGPGAPPPASERQTIAAAAAATSEVPTPTAAASERVEVSNRAPAAAAAAATGTSGLRGRVVHADGQPAANCLVRVLGIDGVALFADAPATGDLRTLPLPRGEARTGDDGVFTIAGLSPRTRYVVNADADGPNRTLRLCNVTPFPERTADLGDFVLEPKASIAGRAVDEAGAPVAGAEVLAMDLPAALAAVLPFDRFVPANGGMLWLPFPEAPAAGDAEAYRDHLRSYLGRELFEHADLDRRPELSTIVVDRLPWLETIWRELPIARATTAADGSFTVHGVEPGGNLLIVRKPGLGIGSKPRVMAQQGERRDVGDVTLPAGEELRGTVRFGDGHGVAGAEVRVGSIGALGCRGVAFAEAPVTTDQSGGFRVTGLGRGRVVVAARANVREAWHVIGPVATDEDVALQLPQRSGLQLRLSRVDGAPVTGVNLELYCGPDLRELRRAGMQTRLPLPAPRQTDDVWSFGEVPVGCYTLHIDADGVMPVETMVVLPQTEPLAVALPAAVRVQVHVHDAAGQPVAGARIYVDSDDASTKAVLPSDYGLPRWTSLPLLAGVTDAGGELQVGVPAKGGWLEATHPLHVPGAVRIEPGATTADLLLPQPGSIAGRLFDRGVPADPRRYCVVAEVDMTMNVPLPDLRAGLLPDGSFAFANVAPTQYKLHAVEVNPAALSLKRLVDDVGDLLGPSFFFEDQPSHRLTVTAGNTATLEFDVDPNQPKPGELPARLTGRASLDGVPLAGAELQRRLDLFRYTTVATVGADGSFAVATLPPGEHSLRLQHKDDAVVLWQCDLALQSGELRVLDLTMATGSLSGTATFATGLPITGHVVTATGACNSGTVERRAEIDAAGRFAFATLPAGDYEVTASGPDGKSEPVRVSIVKGAVAAPLHLALSEVTVLSGRIVGDFARRNAMVLLRSDTWTCGNGLGDDGSFHFSDVAPNVCTLELMVGGKTLKLEPGRFDMSLGSQRNVQVRLTGSAKPDK